jgi:GR25 family glycosyltransferase involved in LPS biosynthesis
MSIDSILNYFDKIYYINLKEDRAKKTYFLSQIKNSIINTKCEKFNAISGKSIDIRLVEDHILTDIGRNDILAEEQKRYGISLTYGSLGCALSHYILLKECKKYNKSFLILEDDIIINSDFDQDLLSIISEIKNIEYDICYLGYNEIPGFNKKVINNVISKPTGLITGTYGMIISSTGASNILDTIFPLSKQIDSSISDNQNKLKLICSTKKMVSANTSFVSKTQRKESCKNYINQDDDPWYRLFDK